jgi:hypothetical protein
MTATTIPWPQVNNENGQQGVVRVSNLAYSLILPLVVVYSAFIIRRRASGGTSGEVVMMLQLACVLVVAIIFFGDPRVRSTYDIFGLALLAACVTGLLGLDKPGGKRDE